jgi:hypothetical protein
LFADLFLKLLKKEPSMKTAIAAILLCFAAVTAQANTPNPYQPVAQPEFYNLKSVRVDPMSQVLPTGKIANGALQIDKENREITISLQPSWQCPAGALCAMVMPEPVTLQLPITYEGGGIAGGRVIVAEVNHLMVDGALVRIQVLDNNSAMMSVDPKFTAIEVTVTEMYPRSDVQIVSTMKAVPFRR